MTATGSTDAAATVLLIDDTPANLAVVVDCLETHQYRVAVARDGQEGVRRAQLIRPDLILLDAMMPGMDGFATCRLLKAEATTRDVPVIFMTALTDTDSKVAAFNAGGLDYITKPFEVAEVLARVHTHIDMARQSVALKREVEERQKAEEQLRLLNIELEERVLQRTAALEAANRGLRLEVETRKAMEARIRRLVDSNIIGVLFRGLDGPITEANEAFLGLIGRERTEVLSGRIGWTDITPPEHRAADEAAMEQMRARGACKPYETECVHKDGSRVPVLVGCALIDGTANECAAFVVDLTERRKAEERQKILLNELNHRVKNTLAVVQAIARQMLRTAASPQAFQESFEDRLMALSQTHNLLFRDHCQGADLLDILNGELVPHDGADHHRVVLEGEGVRLGPTATITLGMAFHELTTNAAKYGALSLPTGQVRVAWSILASNRLHIDWRETGGPPVQSPTRKGFGSQLIERGLARLGNGQIQLDFLPDGIHFIMDMPLEWVSK